MGDSHSRCDASGTPGDLLRAALECETEGPWVEASLHAGRIEEHLSASLRDAALAAFDAAGLSRLPEELLPDALALEAATPVAQPLAPELRDHALAAFHDEASEEAADLGALEELLSDALALERAPAVDERPAASVRQAALAAWDAPAAPVLSFAAAASRRSIRTEPLRARRMRKPLILRPFAAAAMVLVAIGAGLFLFGGSEEAQAGLQLRALSHRNLESTMGMSHIEPRYFAALGRVFAPGDSELLSFGFGNEGLVVVGEGDTVRVTRPGTRPSRPDLGDALDAVLRLESGEARLATRGVPIPLEVDGVGLLVLEEGAAHVALHAESPDGAPAVALAERSVARFHRADGTSVPLSGPTRVQLGADGVTSFGSPARSLFRELAFFGGPLPQPTQVRTVRARLFETRAGATSRGRQDIRVLEAQAGEPASARVAWRPGAALYDAQRLRVALRAPSGTTVSLAQTGSLATTKADDLSATVRRDGDGSEPGLATVEFALPENWFERLPKGLLELTIRVPARQPDAGGDPEPGATTQKKPTRRRKVVRAWFDGVSLVLGPAQDGLPPKFQSVSSLKAKSVLRTKAER